MSPVRSWRPVSRLVLILGAAVYLGAETRYLPAAGVNRRIEDLTSGQTLRLSLPAVDGPTIFASLARIQVPENGTELEVRLATETPSVELGLFVRFNTDVAIENGKGIITYGSEGPAVEKVIVATRDSTPPLRAGTYYIAVGLVTPKTAASATLRATVKTASGGTTPAEPPPAASSRIIATVAGTDPPLPVGQAATDSAIGDPGGVAVDGQGNVLFSATDLDAVFRIARDGSLTLAAGSGTKGYSGNGGAATSARLNSPEGLAIDTAGNLYIADVNNHAIRKVSTDGTITTVAGNGHPGFSGDGGPATSASLNAPKAVAVDSAGNLFVFDTLNHRIRRVEPVGTITTLAGNGVRGFSGDGGPARDAALNLVGDWYAGGIAADVFGNVLLTDSANHRVRRVAADGVISTFAGNGASEQDAKEGQPAGESPVPNPSSVAPDRAGNVYVATSTRESFSRTVGNTTHTDSTLYGRVRQVAASGAMRTVAGGRVVWDGGMVLSFAGDDAPAAQATLGRVGALAWDPMAGLVIVDAGNARLRRVGPDGIIRTIGGNGLPRQATGDGGPALSAALAGAFAVAADPAGGFYFSDVSSNRLRKVSTDGVLTTAAGNGRTGEPADAREAISVPLGQILGMAADRAGNLYLANGSHNRIQVLTPDGAIRTVAGNSDDKFSGDGGPATAAGMKPFDVAVDRAGNIFVADTGNHRIRKVTPEGTISTVAGTGTAGYSGELLPAVSSRLNAPAAVAVDADGVLYVVDSGNQRIRRIDLGGTISTVAGAGVAGYSGDGGPATAARLNVTNASRIRAGADGALYFTDTRNHRVRRIAPDGTITTVAGSGDLGFGGDGGPANRALVAYPSGLDLDAAGNLYVADSSNYRVRVVLAAAPSFEVSAASLEFNAANQGATPPDKSVDLTSRVSSLSFSAVATTTSGGNWLRVAPEAGTLPAALHVSADGRGMAPGVYSGTITVTVPNAEPTVRRIGVRMTVFTPTIPARLLEVSAQRLAFSFVQNGPPSSAALGVVSTAGSPLRYTAAATTSSGGNWLNVAPSSGTTSEAATLMVTARPAGLEAGAYSGKVTVTAGAESVDVPVSMTVQRSRRSLLLSQTGLTFRAVAQGGAPLPQTFRVLTLGGTPLAWTVQAATLSGGRQWLKTAATAESSSVEVSIDAAAMVPGDYYGRIQVEAADAANSPQSLSVLLSVLPAGSNPGPEVQPTGLVFSGTGGTNPPAQEFRISNLRGGPVGFVSARLTLDGRDWFLHQPAGATVLPDRPARVQVFPDFEKLTAGVRRGVITLLFDDGSVRTVDVLSVAAAAGAGPKSTAREAAGCSPTRLVPQVVSLAPGFQAPMFWPVTIEVKVVDDCAVPSTSGSVLARFSTGDPQVSLIPVGDGTWIGTWQPRSTRAEGVRITVLASASAAGVTIEGTTEVSGSLRREAAPPLVSPGGISIWGSPVVRGASAPGSLISIAGESLASTTVTGTANPLDTELGGTTVFLAGRPLPLLYSSDGRIDGQVVYGLGANAQHQLVVRRGAEISLPETVTVTEAQPAVLTKDGSGTGQGLIYLGDTLAEPGHPARAGSVVTLHCVGLGEVTPTATAGARAPAQPMGVAGVVSVSIGGRPAQVQSASLIPGRVGVYQVQAVVPAGIAPAKDALVVLTVAGQSSPAVTMALE